MGRCARAEYVAHFLEGEAVNTKVGEELTILSVIAEHSTLLYSGHTSDTIHNVVIKNVAGNIVSCTSDRRLSRDAGNEEEDVEENHERG